MTWDVFGEAGPIWVLASVLVVAGVAYAIASVVARMARTGLVALMRRDAEVDPGDQGVRRPIRVLRWTMFLALLFTIGLPVIRLAGVDLRVGLSPETLQAWVFGSGLRILLITTAGYVLIRMIAMLVRELEDRISEEGGPDEVERGKRARTLSRLVQSAATTVVVSVAILMILREMRVDITPILTGAGILGLAVGFGGQALVRDLISGFFLIVENQIRVGDAAMINGTSGLVEEINLRTVVLRDHEGTVHVFPNGAITQLGNRTKDYSFYVTDIGVSYRHDPDEVIAVLREVGDDLYADERYRRNILQPLEVLGVDAFMDSQVNIRVRIKTLPLKQWETGRELLRRIKKTFDAKGIEIPFPQRVLHVEDTRTLPSSDG